MKLFNVPRNTWVRILADPKAPPSAPELNVGQPIKLHNIDGMYSYCTDTDGNVVHLVAWAEVEIIEEPKK